MISDYGIFSSPKRGIYIFGGIQGFDSMQNIFRFFEGKLEHIFYIEKRIFFTEIFNIKDTWFMVGELKKPRSLMQVVEQRNREPRTA